MPKRPSSIRLNSTLRPGPSLDLWPKFWKNLNSLSTVGHLNNYYRRYNHRHKAFGSISSQIIIHFIDLELFRLLFTLQIQIQSYYHQLSRFKVRQIVLELVILLYTLQNFMLSDYLTLSRSRSTQIIRHILDIELVILLNPLQISSS